MSTTLNVRFDMTAPPLSKKQNFLASLSVTFTDRSGSQKFAPLLCASAAD
jgi:hypothetical protein